MGVAGGEKGPPGVKGGLQAQEDTLTPTCHRSPCVALRCCSPFCRQPHPIEAHLSPPPLPAQPSNRSNPGADSQNPLGRGSVTGVAFSSRLARTNRPWREGGGGGVSLKEVKSTRVGPPSRSLFCWLPLQPRRDYISQRARRRRTRPLPEASRCGLLRAVLGGGLGGLGPGGGGGGAGAGGGGWCRGSRWCPEWAGCPRGHAGRSEDGRERGGPRAGVSGSGRRPPHKARAGPRPDGGDPGPSGPPGPGKAALRERPRLPGPATSGDRGARGQR